MSELWRVNYLTAGAAAADVPNWTSTGVTVAAQTGPLRLRWTATAGTERSVTRALTGLTIGADYTVTLSVADVTGSWVMTAGSDTGALGTGINGRTFTAEATTETLTVARTGTASASDVVRLYGVWLEEDLPPVDPEAPDPVVVTGTALSHLRDEVEVVTAAATLDDHANWVYDWDNPVVVATLPAYVGYTATALNNSETGRTAFVEQLRAIVPTFNFQPPAHRIRWRGTVYLPDGPALQRLQRGQDHHLTIPIKDVTG